MAAVKRGFIDGYEVLEIGEDGQIIVAPESTLSALTEVLNYYKTPHLNLGWSFLFPNEFKV